MYRSGIHTAIGLAVMLLFATAVYADDIPDVIKERIGAGDPAAGKVKSLICQACHGEDGNPVKPDCPKLVHAGIR